MNHQESLSQRDRMLAGQPYEPADADLTRRRARARDLTARYNATRQDDAVERQAILSALLGRCGEKVWIEPPMYCDYGEHIELGDGVFVNWGCVFLDCGRIRIGRATLLGPYVQLYAGTHPVDPAQRREGWELGTTVTIGQDVWIGGGAIICPGVTIGDGTTIGAGSVVTRDVPPRVVAVGNPCRVIRRLDDPPPTGA